MATIIYTQKNRVIQFCKQVANRFSNLGTAFKTWITSYVNWVNKQFSNFSFNANRKFANMNTAANAAINKCWKRPKITQDVIGTVAGDYVETDVNGYKWGGGSILRYQDQLAPSTTFVDDETTPSGVTCDFGADTRLFCMYVNSSSVVQKAAGAFNCLVSNCGTYSSGCKTQTMSATVYLKTGTYYFQTDLLLGEHSHNEDGENAYKAYYTLTVEPVSSTNSSVTDTAATARGEALTTGDGLAGKEDDDKTESRRICGVKIHSTLHGIPCAEWILSPSLMYHCYLDGVKKVTITHHSISGYESSHGYMYAVNVSILKCLW